MKFGITSSQFEILDQLVIQPLKNQGAKIFIFGSRTTDNYHSHSDVDLLYQMPESRQLSTNILSDIKETVEESKFPFSVDLVASEDLAKSYRETVQSQIVPL